MRRAALLAPLLGFETGRASGRKAGVRPLLFDDAGAQRLLVAEGGRVLMVIDISTQTSPPTMIPMKT